MTNNLQITIVRFVPIGPTNPTSCLPTNCGAPAEIITFLLKLKETFL